MKDIVVIHSLEEKLPSAMDWKNSPRFLIDIENEKAWYHNYVGSYSTGVYYNWQPCDFMEMFVRHLGLTKQDLIDMVDHRRKHFVDHSLDRIATIRVDFDNKSVAKES